MIAVIKEIRKTFIEFEKNISVSKKALKNESHKEHAARMEEIKSAAIELGKHNFKVTKEEAERVKNIMKKQKAMKQTIYFKEDTQELIPIPIEESNCYYVGELKPKVIKRIERLLENKMLSYSELMILLEHNKKFRYSYHEDYIAVSLCEYTKRKKGTPRMHIGIRDINDLKKQ